MTSTLTNRQVKTFRADFFVDPAKPEPNTLIAEVRHDDHCGNGHNTFAITGTLYTPTGDKRDGAIKHAHNGRMLYWASGGCIHEIIAERIPFLAPMIKFHLCSTDGPMYYLANTLHLAGDADCHGHRKGDPSQYKLGVRFGNSPITHFIGDKFWAFLKDRYGAPHGGEFQVIEMQHREPKTYGSKFTFAGFGEKWHECPFDSKIEAEEWAQALAKLTAQFVRLPVAFSEGKARELDAARKAAVWPDATDDELTAPDLRARLEERLPSLMAEFREAVEQLGFTF